MIHQEMIKHISKELENPLLKEKKAMALAVMQGEKRSVLGFRALRVCVCQNSPISSYELNLHINK
jgi:hypothetical protein